jgi:MinD-like ATPase involved in chromosome partitioning or flagellar assembly
MAIDPRNLIQVMLAEEKTLIITFHSYKGGTGKTLLSVNLATIFANRGKKVCLLDLDFSAPSLHAVFKNVKTECWLNDYLNRACKIDDVLKDCGVNCVARQKLFVGLANPSSDAIREMSARDRNWEMEALGRLLSLKDSLESLHFDYVILDTSPGLQYSSINAVVSADSVLVVTTLDRSDMEGTERMMQDLYRVFERKTAVILNKVPFDFLLLKKRERKLESLQLPVIGVIPCSCDILEAEGEYFFACKKPYYVFTRTLQEVAAKIC